MRLPILPHILLVTLLCTSCVTPALWEHTNPQEYVEIPFKDITEQELIESRVSYYRDDRRGVYYAEKSTLTKLRDYTLRAIGTPFTVTLDTAGVAIVVVGLAIVATGKNTACRQDDHCRRTQTPSIHQNWNEQQSRQRFGAWPDF